MADYHSRNRQPPRQVVHALLDLAEQARPYVEAGDGRNALTLLAALAEACCDHLFDLGRASDYECVDVLMLLNELLAEAVLTADLQPRERAEWITRFGRWSAWMSDGGLEASDLTLAAVAAQEWWDEPVLQALLRGDAPPAPQSVPATAGAEAGAANEAVPLPSAVESYRLARARLSISVQEADDSEDEDDEPYSSPAMGDGNGRGGDDDAEADDTDYRLLPIDDEEYRLELHAQLVPSRLRALARLGQVDAYLRLALAEEQTAEYAAMLARTGRAAEAADYARTRLESPAEALQVAQALHTAGAGAAALDIAGQGLTLTPTRSTRLGPWVDSRPSRMEERAALGRWLRDTAHYAGNGDQALRAALAVMAATPDLTEWRVLAEVAGDQWPAVRDQELARLDRVTAAQVDYATVEQHRRSLLDILLHERDMARAMQFVEREQYPDAATERVARAVMATHPHWAWDALCRLAQPVMNGGWSARYEEAAGWLALAKQAVEQAGEPARWHTYYESIQAKHRHKHRLMGLLKPLAPAR